MGGRLRENGSKKSTKANKAKLCANSGIQGTKKPLNKVWSQKKKGLGQKKTRRGPW